MAQDALISVIVPVYKVEPWLERCVDSILGQTYTELEVILVDDGSPDGCGAICDAYAQKDARVRVIHQENGGISSARNAGIDRAKGAFLAFADSDDYLSCEMIENLYKGLTRHNADICISGHYTERGGKLLVQEPPIDADRCYTAREALLVLMQDVRIKNYAWDKLYKAELFEGIRYPESRNYEDIATTYKLFDRAGIVCQVPGYHYYYQIRGGSISSAQSEEKWMANCRDMVAAMRERLAWLEEKGDSEMAGEAMARLIPYTITLLNLQYRFIRRRKDPGQWRELVALKAFLSQRKSEIESNPVLDDKYKRLAALYAGRHGICTLYIGLSRLQKRLPLAERLVAALRRRTQPLPLGYDFSLAEGQRYRIVFFELPCFDNLGDHAIACATQMFLTDLAAEYPEIKPCFVQAWDTTAAVKALRPILGKRDILVFHGGGNLGNLYPFAEAFRYTVTKAFRQNPIILFPQTVYFTDDAIGQRALKKSRKIYGRCPNITMLSRDEYSAKLMRQYYTADVWEIKDIVSYLDKTEYDSGANRSGLLLCLRSDAESALDAEDKKHLEAVCRRHLLPVTVTDTVTLELGDAWNRARLTDKLALFGQARVVVTDRLHGMIFALITKTPCVVLGNNHFKVKKTYDTFADCPYLYYANTPDEVDALLAKAFAAGPVQEKTDYSADFEKLKDWIVAKTR